MELGGKTRATLRVWRIILLKKPVGGRSAAGSPGECRKRHHASHGATVTSLDIRVPVFGGRHRTLGSNRRRTLLVRCAECRVTAWFYDFLPGRARRAQSASVCVSKARALSIHVCRQRCEVARKEREMQWQYHKSCCDEALGATRQGRPWRCWRH